MGHGNGVIDSKIVLMFNI